MGSFEKLGILVIVVIIVMILAVAIYQWGGAGLEPGLPAGLAGGAPSLIVKGPGPYERDYLKDQESGAEADAEEEESGPAAGEGDADTWPGGIPKVYTLEPRENVWVVVVKKWKLKESFTGAIARANPKVDMRRIRPGKMLHIPNPEAYFPDRKTVRPRDATRVYEVAEGDLLETIAKAHLGRKTRWREILEVNPGLDPKLLRPGQRILLPDR